MKLDKYIKENMVLFVLKNIIILFAGVVVFQKLPNYWTNINEKYGYINIKAIVIALSVIILIYGFWILINFCIMRRIGAVKAMRLMEVLFYIMIITLPMYLFHAYESEFKYIFLLVIIATIIEYGLRYGVISALVSATVILGIDLIYAPNVNNINSHFEDDLILVGVFILVAWILGYYVDLETENKNEKENELKVLSTELKEQSRQRNDIEELLLKNNICFDMLFEHSQNAIIVHADDEIIYANESAAKLFGYNEAVQLDEKKFSDYYSKSYVKILDEKYHNIVNNMLSRVTEEETIINSNGSSIMVRNTSSFFVYEGKASVLTFLLDITAEREIETLKDDVEKNLKLLNESREFNILITEFFTNISHEIKTPINIIYVAIQSLEMYVNSCDFENAEKWNQYLKIMKKNSYRMIRLVDNLLDMTKIDSGFMKLNKQNGNIVSVVEDITQAAAEYTKNKNVNVIFDTDVEEKIFFFDDNKIERIMLNLLSNAFKNTSPNGTIIVKLEDQGNNVAISVKDHGQGISKEKLGLIFERFGQANRSLSREYEGCGIGLYLVKSFVEMHNGKISVNSIENKGSEFIIQLPVEIAKGKNAKKAILYETNNERINIEFSDIYNVD